VPRFILSGAPMRERGVGTRSRFGGSQQSRAGTKSARTSAWSR
jgi:hypothetical protein